MAFHFISFHFFFFFFFSFAFFYSVLGFLSFLLSFLRTCFPFFISLLSFIHFFPPQFSFFSFHFWLAFFFLSFFLISFLLCVSFPPASAVFPPFLIKLRARVIFLAGKLNVFGKKTFLLSPEHDTSSSVILLFLLILGQY